MKLWINTLFYIICFFVLTATIYRLAICIPPLPGSGAYTWYRIGAGIIAVLVGGMTVGFAAIAVHLWNGTHRDKKKKDE